MEREMETAVERLRRFARNAQIWKAEVITEELNNAADQVEARDAIIREISEHKSIAEALLELAHAVRNQRDIISRLEGDLELLMNLLEEEREKKHGPIN